MGNLENGAGLGAVSRLQTGGYTQSFTFVNLVIPSRCEGNLIDLWGKEETVLR